MDESEANALAGLIGGEAWQSGGCIWVARRDLPGEAIQIATGDAIGENDGEEALQAARPRWSRRVGPTAAAWN